MRIRKFKKIILYIAWKANCKIKAVLKGEKNLSGNAVFFIEL